MNSLALINIGTTITGDLHNPMLENVDTILCEDGVIKAIGPRDKRSELTKDVYRIMDVMGATVAPGLIDSHCHVVIGDYTPRQKTVGFLDSYTHGGITRVISAGEIHAPGRTHDAWAVKALALAANSFFRNFHPNGMQVHAGTIILEPNLNDDDFAELYQCGVRLAKFGFGDYSNPQDGEVQIRFAQKRGIKVMCHSGGASVPGSRPITADDLFVLRPDVYGHINGGPTSLDFDGVTRLLHETDGALQLVQAGNLRSSLEILKVATNEEKLERIVVGSDTPTGTGVIPLGVIKTLAELCSLGNIAPELAWCLATGNNAKAFDTPGGILKTGEAADLVVMDAPWGSLASDALGALGRGDIPGISGVIIAGRIRVLRSRNTPAASTQVVLTPEIEGFEE